MKYFDRLIGVYHFLFDRAPGKIPVVDAKLRKQNPWLRDGQPVVARVKATGHLSEDVARAISLLGSPLPVSRGDKVMLKPNFNSADPFPASTDIAFLQAVIELFLESGVKVTIGESAGGAWRPTRKVFRQVKLYELAKQLNVELIAFDDRPKDWVRIRIFGEHLYYLTMPRSAYEADRLIYLPCMKTHWLARYSAAIKLAFGFVHPGERRAFHLSHLEDKLAEVNLCWQPDLIITDGRKSFVTGGPASGKLVEPGIILASGDLVANDYEAVKLLQSYKAANKLLDNPLDMPQIATALRHGLGKAPGTIVI